MTDLKHYIGGKLETGSGRETNLTRPADGTAFARLRLAGEAEANKALEAARDAFPVWSSLKSKDRKEWMLRLRDELLRREDAIVEAVANETGKIYGGAYEDFQMLINCLEFFPEEEERLRGEIIDDPNEAAWNFLTHKPLGVVVAYLAWNFPLLNVGYKLGPCLASGCTIVIKPASKTPAATLLVGEAAEAIGFPKGVINIIAGPAATLSKVMSASKIPAMLTMIGSSAAGKQLIADSATSIKRFSLELGGNAPAVVLEDADLDNAVSATVGLKFGNCGQVCVSPNRVFVAEKLYDDFCAKAKELASDIKLGWYKDPGARMGPMIDKADRDRMLELIEDAVAKGAKVLCGGGVPGDMPKEGNWIAPCVLADVTREMRVYQEEIFGPVMPIVKLTAGMDPAEAANDTEYGLAAYLFTENVRLALGLSQKMKFGSVSVNKPLYAYNLPHGGVKESGIGKDCSHLSLEEYYWVQRVSVSKG